MAETLEERLVKDQLKATKEKNRFKLNVIRGLRAELQNAEKEKRSSLTPEEEVSILQREIKRRKEALSDYLKSGREDLHEQLKEEIQILEDYLPQQLSDEEIRQIIHQAVEETGAVSPREAGKVMGKIMPRVKGQADGNRVKALVEEVLSGKQG